MSDPKPAATYADAGVSLDAGEEAVRRILPMLRRTHTPGVIADIGAGTDTMTGKGAKASPALGLVKVAQAVNQYGSHFDHPGFKPIRNVH